MLKLNNLVFLLKMEYTDTIVFCWGGGGVNKFQPSGVIFGHYMLILANKVIMYAKAQQFVLLTDDGRYPMREKSK